MNRFISFYKKVRFFLFRGSLTFRSLYKNPDTLNILFFDKLKIVSPSYYYQLDRSKTIFLYCIYHNQLNLVQQFIDHGFTFHLCSSLPLEIAAARGYNNIIEFLISKNAYIDENYSTFYDDTISLHPPLEQSVKYNQHDTFHYLLKHTPVISVHIYRAFIFACRYNCLDIIKFLASSYSHLSLFSYYNHRCINFAAQFHYDQMIEFFIENGENLSHIENYEDRKYYESYFNSKKLNETLSISQKNHSRIKL